MNRDERGLNETGEGEDPPVFFLPGTSATSMQGVGAGASTINPLVPSPIVSESERGIGGSDFAGTPDGLPDRVEQTLAEDGRFSALLPALVVTADGVTGHVTLSGSLTDGTLRPSLLSTLHAIPGVTGVADETE